MKMKFKNLIACTSLLFAAQLAFSVETGGLVTNDTTFANVEKDGALKLNQKNGANIWLRLPITADGSSYFTAEGAFKSEYIASEEDSDKKLKLTLDATLFKLSLKKELSSGDLQLSAGRFFNADTTGLIYSQNGDGLKFDANISRVSFSLYGAYTGLLNAKNVTILAKDNNSDLTTDLNTKNVTILNQGNNSELSPDLTDKGKTLYVVAKKYAVGAATFSLPNIFAGQTISIEGLGAFSLESTKYSRMYGTLALTGPVISPVFYSVTSTIGMFKYDDGDTEKGNLSTASISAYPDFKSMSISLNGVYASGEQGSFKGFRGFTSSTAADSLASPEYKNIAKGGISATIKPVSNLLLNASGDIVFNTAGGDDKDKIEQAGFQYSAGFNFQVLSDVSLGASFTQFISKNEYNNEADNFKGIGGNKTQLKITAAIAF